MKIALPCIHFSVRERRIINEHGFMSMPQFLDNHYVKDRKSCVKWLEKHLREYGNGLIQFAIAPDYQYEEAERLRQEWDVNWVFPLHKRDEDFSKFEWVGFPHRPEFRDYELDIFMKLTEGKKRWYLGFWDESRPEISLLFDGFDTTLPETYSGKYGKLWHGWGKNEPNPLGLPTIQSFEYNVIRFKIEMIKLINTQAKQNILTSYDCWG